MRVLVADDSAVSRKVLQRTLAGWGYEAVPCADGREAWEMLQREDAPPIAILDWVMPGLDGIEVCRRLRALPERGHVFVYLLTGRTSVEDMLAGLEAGADDYLTKPLRSAELRIRLRNGRRLVELHAELVRTREVLRAQAMVDPLTQVANRRAFVETAQRELGRAGRAQRPTSVLMLDLDHFKAVNDTYGHAAGDAVLVEVARRLSATLRDADCLGRLGGEEFAVVLPECGLSDALIVAERLRREIARAPIAVPGTRLAVTASIGVASTLAGRDSIVELLDLADGALYQAKAKGRNRCVLARDALPRTGT